MRYLNWTYIKSLFRKLFPRKTPLAGLAVKGPLPEEVTLEDIDTLITYYLEWVTHYRGKRQADALRFFLKSTTLEFTPAYMSHEMLPGKFILGRAMTKTYIRVWNHRDKWASVFVHELLHLLLWRFLKDPSADHSEWQDSDHKIESLLLNWRPGDELSL